MDVFFGNYDIIILHIISKHISLEVKLCCEKAGTVEHLC